MIRLVHSPGVSPLESGLYTLSRAEEARRDWLAKGAQPTEAVANLLAVAGIEEMAQRKQAAKELRARRAAHNERSGAKGRKKS